MDPSHASSSSSSSSSASSSIPRSRVSAAASSAPILRSRTASRTLKVVGIALVTAGVGFNYVATTMRDNEQAQKRSSDPNAPNLYVSVDRSGGGI